MTSGHFVWLPCRVFIKRWLKAKMTASRMFLATLFNSFLLHYNTVFTLSSRTINFLPYILKFKQVQFTTHCASKNCWVIGKVYTLMRHCVLWHFIWIYTVCSGMSVRINDKYGNVDSSHFGRLIFYSGLLLKIFTENPAMAKF